MTDLVDLFIDPLVAKSRLLAIAYTDDAGMWEVFESGFSSKMPLPRTEWCPPNGTAASVVRIPELGCTALPHDHPAFCVPNSPVHWYRKPYVYLLLARIEPADYNTYVNTNVGGKTVKISVAENAKAKIKAWCDGMVADGAEWMVIYMPQRTGREARSFVDTFRAFTGASQYSNTSLGMSFYSSTFNAIRADCGGRRHASRFFRIDHFEVFQRQRSSAATSDATLRPLDADTTGELESQWRTLMNHLHVAVYASLSMRIRMHLDELGRLSAQKNQQRRWNYGHFFGVKESLAFVYAQVLLLNQSLQCYQELERELQLVENREADKTAAMTPLERLQAAAALADSRSSSPDSVDDAQRSSSASSTLNRRERQARKMAKDLFDQSGLLRPLLDAMKRPEGISSRGFLERYPDEVIINAMNSSRYKPGSWLPRAEKVPETADILMRERSDPAALRKLRCPPPHLLDLSNLPYRELIYTSEISLPDFHHYLFARQCMLMQVLIRQKSTAPPGKPNEVTDEMLAFKACEFIKLMTNLSAAHVAMRKTDKTCASAWLFRAALDLYEICTRRKARPVEAPMLHTSSSMAMARPSRTSSRRSRLYTPDEPTSLTPVAANGAGIHSPQARRPPEPPPRLISPPSRPDRPNDGTPQAVSAFPSPSKRSVALNGEAGDGAAPPTAGIRSAQSSPTVPSLLDTAEMNAVKEEGEMDGSEEHDGEDDVTSSVLGGDFRERTYTIHDDEDADENTLAIPKSEIPSEEQADVVNVADLAQKLNDESAEVLASTPVKSISNVSSPATLDKPNITAPSPLHLTGTDAPIINGSATSDAPVTSSPPAEAASSRGPSPLIRTSLHRNLAHPMNIVTSMTESPDIMAPKLAFLLQEARIHLANVVMQAMQHDVDAVPDLTTVHAISAIIPAAVVDVHEALIHSTSKLPPRESEQSRTSISAPRNTRGRSASLNLPSNKLTITGFYSPFELGHMQHRPIIAARFNKGGGAQMSHSASSLALTTALESPTDADMLYSAISLLQSYQLSIMKRANDRFACNIRRANILVRHREFQAAQMLLTDTLPTLTQQKWSSLKVWAQLLLCACYLGTGNAADFIKVAYELLHGSYKHAVSIWAEMFRKKLGRIDPSATPSDTIWPEAGSSLAFSVYMTHSYPQLIAQLEHLAVADATLSGPFKPLRLLWASQWDNAVSKDKSKDTMYSFIMRLRELHLRAFLLERLLDSAKRMVDSVTTSKFVGASAVRLAMRPLFSSCVALIGTPSIDDDDVEYLSSEHYSSGGNIGDFFQPKRLISREPMVVEVNINSKLPYTITVDSVEIQLAVAKDAAHKTNENGGVDAAEFPVDPNLWIPIGNKRSTAPTCLKTPRSMSNSKFPHCNVWGTSKCGAPAAVSKTLSHTNKDDLRVAVNSTWMSDCVQQEWSADDASASLKDAADQDYVVLSTDSHFSERRHYSRKPGIIRSASAGDADVAHHPPFMSGVARSASEYVHSVTEVPPASVELHPGLNTFRLHTVAPRECALKVTGVRIVIASRMVVLSDPAPLIVSGFSLRHCVRLAHISALALAARRKQRTERYAAFERTCLSEVDGTGMITAKAAAKMESVSLYPVKTPNSSILCSDPTPEMLTDALKSKDKTHMIGSTRPLQHRAHEEEDALPQWARFFLQWLHCFDQLPEHSTARAEEEFYDRITKGTAEFDEDMTCVRGLQPDISAPTNAEWFAQVDPHSIANIAKHIGTPVYVTQRGQMTLGWIRFAHSRGVPAGPQTGNTEMPDFMNSALHSIQGMDAPVQHRMGPHFMPLLHNVQSYITMLVAPAANCGQAKVQSTTIQLQLPAGSKVAGAVRAYKLTGQHVSHHVYSEEEYELYISAHKRTKQRDEVLSLAATAAADESYGHVLAATALPPPQTCEIHLNDTHDVHRVSVTVKGLSVGDYCYLIIPVVIKPPKKPTSDAKALRDVRTTLMESGFVSSVVTCYDATHYEAAPLPADPLTDSTSSSSNGLQFACFDDALILHPPLSHIFTVGVSLQSTVCLPIHIQQLHDTAAPFKQDKRASFKLDKCASLQSTHIVRDQHIPLPLYHPFILQSKVITHTASSQQQPYVAPAKAFRTAPASCFNLLSCNVAESRVFNVDSVLHGRQPGDASSKLRLVQLRGLTGEVVSSATATMRGTAAAAAAAVGGGNKVSSVYRSEDTDDDEEAGNTAAKADKHGADDDEDDDDDDDDDPVGYHDDSSDTMVQLTVVSFLPRPIKIAAYSLTAPRTSGWSMVDDCSKALLQQSFAPLAAARSRWPAGYEFAVNTRLLPYALAFAYRFKRSISASNAITARFTVEYEMEDLPMPHCTVESIASTLAAGLTKVSDVAPKLAYTYTEDAVLSVAHD